MLARTSQGRSVERLQCPPVPDFQSVSGMVLACSEKEKTTGLSSSGTQALSDIRHLGTRSLSNEHDLVRGLANRIDACVKPVDSSTPPRMGVSGRSDRSGGETESRSQGMNIIGTVSQPSALVQVSVNFQRSRSMEFRKYNDALSTSRRPCMLRLSPLTQRTPLSSSRPLLVSLCFHDSSTFLIPPLLKLLLRLDILQAPFCGGQLLNGVFLRLLLRQDIGHAQALGGRRRSGRSQVTNRVHLAALGRRSRRRGGP